MSENLWLGELGRGRF